MKLSHLTLAVASSLTMMSAVHAGCLEYTKQSILPFFEEGNYAEISYATVDMNIEGEDTSGNKIDNMMDEFDLPGAAVKIAPTEDTAVAFIYDTPFGVDTIYPEGNDFNNVLGVTEARLSTDSLTTLVGGKVNDNVWIYGGLEYQQADGGVTAATPFEGAPTYYQLEIKEDSDTWIPVVGFAYEIPEIMLRAAVTYHAEGHHTVAATESLLIGEGGANFNALPDFVKVQNGLPTIDLGDILLEINTPQSINLDFQTGLSEKYQLLGMINARWVDWSAFEIAPEGITQILNEPLAYYNEDQYSVEVALAKQITPKFAGEVRIGYDTGTGEPLSLLGPYNSTQSVAVGGQYDITDNLLVAAGAQYMWLEGGDVTNADGTQLQATAEDGDIIAYGMKVGYRF